LWFMVGLAFLTLASSAGGTSSSIEARGKMLDAPGQGGYNSCTHRPS
jgi:hypothetical protein